MRKILHVQFHSDLSTHVMQPGVDCPLSGGMWMTMVCVELTYCRVASDVQQTAGEEVAYDTKL